MLAEQVISPCHGEVKEVFVHNGDYIYEWETLFVIKGEETEAEVSIGISGNVKKLYIKKGDRVAPKMVLATLEDDMVISGSD
ncbi:biotin/lipoyl-containing protein [Halobacillus mangrovi]|uniref:Lipoyl-binding domain-containing protein n=1 Tax=Halobacillus mangrovi TaxID=402384 RepID=A0A1W5ZZW3_9BACI|nr:biotin/lipoyl-containing protein [Halobacillus mangrovi]ARI78787.1 hypothetical protein HM131_18945 [Halobacillus mangrovi]